MSEINTQSSISLVDIFPCNEKVEFDSLQVEIKYFLKFSCFTIGVHLVLASAS